ncbi:hypothetical protein [Aestuariimicrobium ganziense]|uniref:hypothetical protein n=1 Tax=Aestuariimicrobium ganziense TaxID=2773677 RepID=UPI0019419BED|nr:hypothetical protein [Aestuariimicrobium ganziense]
MTQTTPPAATTSSLRTLRGMTLAMSVLAVLQAVLGFMLAAGVDGIRDVHGWSGYALFIVSIVAAVFAWKYSRENAHKGVFYHATSIPVMGLLQIGLAEMGAETIHIVLGVAIAVAVIGLWTMLRRH